MPCPSLLLPPHCHPDTTFSIRIVAMATWLKGPLLTLPFWSNFPILGASLWLHDISPVGPCFHRGRSSHLLSSYCMLGAVSSRPHPGMGIVNTLYGRAQLRRLKTLPQGKSGRFLCSWNWKPAGHLPEGFFILKGYHLVPFSFPCFSTSLFIS